MKLVIGGDHAGYDLKEYLKEHLKDIEFDDRGAFSADSVDYPDFAHAVSKVVKEGNVNGVLICGSANGVAMSANKHAGVRAAICWEPELAALAKQHNNANIICLPARFISRENALEIVKAYIKAEFEGGRHARRVDKIACT